jgi:hypothetical protein
MAFTCPKCLMVSHNPEDERQGYCGNCHEFTGVFNVSWPEGPRAERWMLGGPGSGMLAGQGGTIDLGLSDMPHEHDWVYKDDEYDSLGNGGSYQIFECSTCGKSKYVQLPD